VTPWLADITRAWRLSADGFFSSSQVRPRPRRALAAEKRQLAAAFKISGDLGPPPHARSTPRPPLFPLLVQGLLSCEVVRVWVSSRFLALKVLA